MATSDISQWLASQRTTPVDPLGDFGIMSSYGKNAAIPTPDLFSAKDGFDWGGATSAGATDWAKGLGYQGTGGFDGSGVANSGGMFGGDFWKNMLGSKDKDGIGTNGWGSMALGAANTFMNMKNYGLAEQQFNQNKALTTANFNNQLALTRDRQDDIFKRDTANAALNNRAAPTAPRQLTGLV